MRIFITGGAGFIGSHLATYHIRKGDEVWVVDNFLAGKEQNIQALRQYPSFRLDREDVLIWQGLEQAVSWADRIYHMAAVVGQKKVAQDPVYVIKNNVQGCECVLEAVRKSGKKIPVLIASSSSVYGHETHSSYQEDASLTVLSGEYRQQSYSLSKLMNEEQALAYGDQYGLHCVIVRLFNVIGPNQSDRYGAVVPNFISQAQKGEPFTIYGKGTQTRSFGYVLDIVEAMDLLVTSPEAKGQIVNIGSTEEISVQDLACKVQKILQSSSGFRFVSYEEAYGYSWKEIERRQPNIEKLIGLTGFRPKYTLDQALEEIIREKKLAKK